MEEKMEEKSVRLLARVNKLIQEEVISNPEIDTANFTLQNVYEFVQKVRNLEADDAPIIILKMSYAYIESFYAYAIVNLFRIEVSNKRTWASNFRNKERWVWHNYNYEGIAFGVDVALSESLELGFLFRASEKSYLYDQLFENKKHFFGHFDAIIPELIIPKVIINKSSFARPIIETEYGVISGRSCPPVLEDKNE